MLRPEDAIGPYTLVRALGSGAFGSVWLAERRASLLTTQVALKIPLAGDANHDSIRQEAHTWLTASGHPNIVPVLEAEVYGDQIVIASEYIAGGSLEDWLRENGGKSPSQEHALDLARGILAGLGHLHETGVIHRDLKPGNVLLQKGIPRLTDFGLSRILRTERHTSRLEGTPGYMAPECFRGDYSVASDLWAAGVLLYELLSGALPYPQKELYSLVTAIMSGAEPEPLPESVPEPLRIVTMRALARDRGSRFASVGEMLTAINDAARASALPSQSVALPIRSNLPVQTSSFIGRENEMQAIKSLLASSRLLALIGAGGCGKTRLMLQVAETALENYPDGVWLVELAPVSDPALVPRTLASALDVVEQPGKSLLQGLTETLKTKKMLLLLDNCEHLLSACSATADSLLRACPQVKILVTSREGLGISGEQAYHVPSLSLPDRSQPATIESVIRCESARLFVERASLIRSDFAVTAQNAPALASVCHRLDGIPLAIELAAARSRSLTVEEINTKLDHRFRLLTGGSRAALPRQQTLRALIDWSYNLLNDREKTLLLRLSVFAGGWTLKAAEDICAGEGAGCRMSGAAGAVGTTPDTLPPTPFQDYEVLDLLTALVDKSLVQYHEVEGAGRYRLLETIRQYAQEKLWESAEGVGLRARHRDYYLSLAEQAASRMQTPDKEAGLSTLQSELDNLRAALHWSLETREIERGLRLALAVDEFWIRYNVFGEAVEWFARLLSNRQDSSPNTVTVKALCAAGTACWHLGRYPESRAYLEEAVSAARTSGNEADLRRALNALANTLYYQGQFAAARPLYEETLELARKSGSARDLGKALNNLGLVENDAGNLQAAQRLFEEALELRRRLGDPWGIANILNALGTIALSAGDVAKAEALLLESYTLYMATPDRLALSYTLHSLARLRMRQEQWVEARRLILEGLRIKRETGEKWGVGITLQAMVEWLHATGDSRRACILLGAADALLASIGSDMPPTQKQEYEHLVASLCTSVSQPVFEGLSAEGRRMTMEQAVDYAMKPEVA